MSYGPIKVFSGQVASGASTVSFALDKAYTTVYAEVGTMSTAAAFSVYGSTNGTSWYALNERVNTSSVQYQAITIASGSVANGGVVPIPEGLPHYQFRATAVVSGGVVFKLICSD